MNVKKVTMKDGGIFYYCKMPYDAGIRAEYERFATETNTPILQLIAHCVRRIGNTFCQPKDVTFTVMKNYVECVFKC